MTPDPELRALTERLAGLEVCEATTLERFARSAEAVVVVDAGGSVCFANPVAERLMDRELLGHPLGLPIVTETEMELVFVRKRVELVTITMLAREVAWQRRPAFVLVFAESAPSAKHA